MDVTEALLDSWDRQCNIVALVSQLVNKENRNFKPSQDGWSLDKQLAHMHHTRKYFLTEISPNEAAVLKNSYLDESGENIAELETLRANLEESGKAVRNTVLAGIEAGNKPLLGTHVTYDNPILFLQHLVWHEGWHCGMIFLALRLNGQEPPEEWEEPSVWGQWRTETW